MGDDASDQKRTIAARADPRSTHELISIVLTGADEDTAWEAVTVLHWRGTREVFDAARQLCASECPKERALGADILAQLGIPERSIPDEALAILTGLLQRDQENDVLSSAAFACGHLHDARAVGALVKLKNHSHEDVRYAVVFGLLGHPDRRAVRALIKLSADPDAHVRDWATFGLGQQIDTNTREVREALFARVEDEDDDTRAEALMGLARRHDARVIEPLIEELRSDAVTILVVEAAGETGDPRLYSPLAALRGRGDVDSSFIEEAIARCLSDDRKIGATSVVSTEPSATSLPDDEP